VFRKETALMFGYKRCVLKIILNFNEIDLKGFISIK